MKEKTNLPQSYHQGEPVVKFFMYIKHTFLLKMVARFRLYFMNLFKKINRIL